MANEWSILSPVAATNLVTNPSVETATTGYTATSTGTTIAAATTYARRGAKSLSVAPAASTTEGVYYGALSLTSGTSYTASLDVLGAAAIPYKLYFGDTSGTLKGTATSITGTGSWKRESVTWACDGTASYRVYLAKNNSASTATYYLDGLQCEATAYATSYIDGDQKGTAGGYAWTGAAHASTSTRSAQERSGGRAYYLDTDIGTRVLLMDGAGMAPLEIYSEQRSLLPGAEFQGTRTAPREMNLVVFTGSASVTGFHSQRKDLIDLVKPDLVYPDQPFILRYGGANTNTDPLELSVVYWGGLEFGAQNYKVDRVALRLMAYDPYWRETGNEASTLDGYGTGTFYYIAGRLKSSGAWSTLGLTQVPTSGGIIYDIKANPFNTDEIFIGGDFTGLNGVAGRDMLAKYTISTNTWSTVGSTGGIGDAVHCLLFASDGTLYFGGEFTNVGSTDGDYLAKWTSGGGLAAVAAGGTGPVYALAQGPDGKIFIGGDFDNWGAVADADNLAYWDGSAYAAVGTGADDTVNALQIMRRGGSNYSLYVGGLFANIGGTAADCVAITSDLTNFYEVGGGISGGENVSSLALAPDYTLYIGNQGAGGGVYRNWNTIEALPDTIFKTARALKYDTDTNILYIVGSAGAVAGQIPIRTFSGGSGGEVDLQFDPADTAAIYAVESINGNLFIGMADDYAIAYPGGVATVTNNGTAASYPVFRIKRSGGTSATIKRITNETTGAKVEFADYSLMDGEEIIVDFRLTNRSVTSNIYGSIWQAVSRGSDFANFYLAPGANLISCLIPEAGSPTMTISIQWQRSHWSIDGVAA